MALEFHCPVIMECTLEGKVYCQVNIGLGLSAAVFKLSVMELHFSHVFFLSDWLLSLCMYVTIGNG